MQSSDLPSQSLLMAKPEAGKVIQSSGNAVHRAGSHVRGSTWAMAHGVLHVGFRRGKVCESIEAALSFASVQMSSNVNVY